MPLTSLAESLKHFDPNAAQIESGTLTERRLSQLAGCFADPTAYAKALEHDDPIVYSVSSLEPAHGDGDLHIGLGRIMPGKVGTEYFLTRGHLHSWREAAEIYIGIAGDGLMLLEVEGGEAQAVPLLANSIVYVPGFTAHRTVNVGSSPLTYLGIYPAKAGHDYAAIAQNNFRQMVIERDGQAVTIKRKDWLELQQV
jgi:glucose-6-phosphate isomerase, archaeal